MAERDSLTDWFHSLAAKSPSELEVLASPDNIALLRTHISRSIPEYSLPDNLEQSEFAEAVVTFKRNESAWNRATQLAISKAEELAKAGFISEASESLRMFAASCPWELFKEVALNQATHFE